MKPLNNYIILIPKKPREKTSAGLLLLPKDIDQGTLGFGTVYAAPPDCGLKNGDEIIFNKWSPCQWTLGGADYYSLKLDDVIAVI